MDFVILGVIFLLPSGYLTFNIYTLKKLKVVFEKAPLLSVKDLAKGFTRINGKVKTEAETKTILSPVNKASCVYYKLLVEYNDGTYKYAYF